MLFYIQRILFFYVVLKEQQIVPIKAEICPIVLATSNREYVHQVPRSTPPPEKTIFTIFRMTLLIILWVSGTSIDIGLTAPLVKNPAYGPGSKYPFEMAVPAA
jgi:hypothetical protein